jgi:hypothetical protein
MPVRRRIGILKEQLGQRRQRVGELLGEPRDAERGASSCVPPGPRAQQRPGAASPRCPADAGHTVPWLPRSPRHVTNSEANHGTVRCAAPLRCGNRRRQEMAARARTATTGRRSTIGHAERSGGGARTHRRRRLGRSGLEGEANAVTARRLVAGSSSRRAGQRPGEAGHGEHASGHQYLPEAIGRSAGLATAAGAAADARSHLASKYRGWTEATRGPGSDFIDWVEPGQHEGEVRARCPALTR